MFYYWIIYHTLVNPWNTLIQRVQGIVLSMLLWCSFVPNYRIWYPVLLLVSLP